MSDPDDTQREATAESNGVGVLANLPRTRPQRSSPRRVAARARSAAAASRGEASETSKTLETSSSNGSKAGPNKTGPNKTGPNKPAKVRTAKRKPTAGASAPEPAPAPRQGFECESEHTSRTVQPPGGAELVASVAEIVGELAKSGLATGERLLKDALSRLPLS
jgi:hypothetical protein